MSETTNLKLFKHDEPLSTNQNQFDIDKALHQNWDKIDEYVGANNQNIQTLQNQNTDLQQQNANLQEENNLLKSQIPNGQAEGENITLTDSSNLPYEKFNIGGNSVQDGTPTPETPVEIKSVGEEGTVEIKQTNEDGSLNNDYVLQISEPLRSLPNGVRDTIEEDGIHRRVGSIVFDGSDDENWIITTYSNGNIRFICKISDSKASQLPLISHFISNWTNEYNTGFIGSESALYLLYNISTIEEFKTCLQQNPITVQYELAEEIIGPYTDNPLQNATSYKNITNIFSTDEVSPVFDITYKKDLETLFNNLNSALVEGGM